MRGMHGRRHAVLYPWLSIRISIRNGATIGRIVRHAAILQGGRMTRGPALPFVKEGTLFCGAGDAPDTRAATWHFGGRHC